MTTFNRIAIGTVQFGMDYGIANNLGKVKSTEVEQILSLARHKGIDLLDTAIAYGSSEKVIGETELEDFRVVTKLPPLPKDSIDIKTWIKNQVKSSLSRLNQDKLYGLLLHRPKDLIEDNGRQLIETLLDCKNEGIVEKIGVSIYSPDELNEICNSTQIDIVQAPLNIIDRRMEESGWLKRLKEKNVEIHARSVFLQGLVLMEQNKIPKKFSRWSNLWNAWHKSLKHTGISPLAVCLEYPLSLREIDHVILGMDSTKQLFEILDALENLEGVFDSSFMRSDDLDLINPSNWSRL